MLALQVLALSVEGGRVTGKYVVIFIAVVVALPVIRRSRYEPQVRIRIDTDQVVCCLRVIPHGSYRQRRVVVT
jgi:hypothetical protein